MKACARLFMVALVGGLATTSNTATATDRGQSAFLKLAADLTVNTTGSVTVVSKTFTVGAAVDVFAVADGRYFPVDAPAGSVRIAIDGSESFTSFAITDWGSSDDPVQHSFNAIASTHLSAGTHTIAMVASSHPTRPGRFKIANGSALSILVAPRAQMTSVALSGESANINLTTYDPAHGINTVEGGAARPSVALLTSAIHNPLPQLSSVISYVSGRAFNSCDSGIDDGFGDALWGLWANGTCQSTGNASWSVNDIDVGAETQAPMYAHSWYPISNGETKTITFRASELAFGSDQAGSPSGAHENGVCYKVGSARMVSFAGATVGGAVAGGTNSFCSTYTFKCVATTLGEAGCPPAGADDIIGSGSVFVPAGDDGIVYFSAKTRIQAGNDDGFATAALTIKVDGVARGTTGVQQLASGAGQSSRTLSASYISAPGTNSAVLTPGFHNVAVSINVSGTPLHHPSVPQDVVLTYVD